MRQSNTEQIKADIIAARGRLAEGVQGLVSEVHPAALKTTISDSVSSTVGAQVEKVKSLVVDSAGIRWDRIGTAAMVAVSVCVTSRILKGFGRLLRRS